MSPEDQDYVAACILAGHEGHQAEGARQHIVPPDTMTNRIVDSAAFVVLCLLGFTSTFLIWVAGSPRYGVLSTLWREVGVATLIGCSVVAFIVAGLLLRRMYRAGSPPPTGLVILGMVSAAPFAFLVVILTARAVLGE